MLLRFVYQWRLRTHSSLSPTCTTSSIRRRRPGANLLNPRTLHLVSSRRWSRPEGSSTLIRRKSGSCVLRVQDDLLQNILRWFRCNILLPSLHIPFVAQKWWLSVNSTHDLCLRFLYIVGHISCIATESISQAGMSFSWCASIHPVPIELGWGRSDGRAPR